MKATLIVTNPAEGLYWKEAELTAGERDFVHQVNIYPQRKRQTFQGIGGAFTEAAARCWRQLPAERTQALLNCYFGPDGLGYTLRRVPMGSSDFSVGHYSCVDSPRGGTLCRRVSASGTQRRRVRRRRHPCLGSQQGGADPPRGRYSVRSRSGRGCPGLCPSLVHRRPL